MISKMFLRGDSVILVLRNPLAQPPAAAPAETKEEVKAESKKRERDD